jgi:hypothetical protein
MSASGGNDFFSLPEELEFKCCVEVVACAKLTIKAVLASAEGVAYRGRLTS